MAQFMLFYLTGPGEPPPPLSEEEVRSVISEYVAWSDKRRAEGCFLDGARLTSVWKDPGRVCSTVDGEFVATDGPLAETKEAVGGYGVIEAADYNEAVSLCRTHPAARYGSIVIRQLA